MLSKRGQFILIVALEILAAIFASFLLFKISMSWASGEVAEKLYYSKDLALLADSLFIAPDVTVFYYKDNLSRFDLAFRGDALKVSVGVFDPTEAIRYFTPFRNSSTDSVLKNPKTVVFTRSGANLSVGLGEDFSLSSFSHYFVSWQNFEDLEIKDSKKVFVSSDKDLASLVKSEFFPDLKRLLVGFDVRYVASVQKVDGVLIVFEKSIDRGAVKVIYPVGGDKVVSLKSRKFAMLLFKSVDVGAVSLPVDFSYLDFGSDQVGLVVGLGEDVLVDKSKVYGWVVNGLNDYFGEVNG